MTERRVTNRKRVAAAGLLLAIRPSLFAEIEAAMAEFDVDLFVIGGGSGGVRAARIAAGHGASVMIAEEYRMGGTCVIRGCVPKKLLVYASHPARDRRARGFGWTIPAATFDWPTLIANKDNEIARLEAAYTTNVEKSGARVVKARAVFEDAHTCGSRPARPSRPNMC